MTTNAMLKLLLYLLGLVSGEAKFIMSSTRLTIGGFTHTSVARSFIDMPSNSEKGLSSIPVGVSTPTFQEVFIPGGS